jgi:signal transduction histidine kinase
MRQQLRQAFQSVTLEKSRNAAIIQHMGVAAVITDHSLNIAAVNPAAEALLKQSQANLLDKSWHTVFDVNGVNGLDGKASPPFWSLGETEAGGNHNLMVRGRFPLRAHSQITLDVISTQVEVEGEPAGFVHILQDASAQEQLVRAKDEFIMNAAHELRGPLASLRASIELLVEDYATMSKPDLGVMLRTMQRAVVKFQGLVENLVDMGNIQAGRFRVRPVSTQLSGLIQDALAQVDPLLRGRGQSTEVKIDCPSVFVSADRPRIVQVLINLLTNASKYGPEREPITLSAHSDEGCVVIEVTDRGAGIAPEEQAHLFQRFYRGRRAEEEGIGIGLGLALAREIVTAHGGQMDVRSQIGEGTTFWFSLPKVDQSVAR